MPGADVAVREATTDDLAGALNVLDGAALAVDHDSVSAADGGETVFVALPVSTDYGHGGETVLGALVLDGERITAVAVRRRRRGQGIGTALVEAAAGRRERLVATFDTDVCQFYERLGFDVESAETAGRFRGVYEEG